MLRTTLLNAIIMATLGFTTTSAWGTFIPPEDIKNPYQVFSERDANMTKAEFNAVIKHAKEMYAPIIKSHGGTLKINALWDDDTLNASASQFFGQWTVNMYGGLARHPEMTLDGFAMVLCHELGHHLAGFAFKKGGFSLGGVWAANEGQSDYFAAHSCARELWKDDLELNATFKDQMPEVVIESCNVAWETEADRNLCYRVNAGGESLARVLSALGKDPVAPDFETPDTNKVNVTDSSHPDAQCRLDTTYAASLCKTTFNIDLIPGKKMSDPFGKEAEKESASNTCTEYGDFVDGLRPRCWFKPSI